MSNLFSRAANNIKSGIENSAKSSIGNGKKALSESGDLFSKAANGIKSSNTPATWQNPNIVDTSAVQQYKDTPYENSGIDNWFATTPEEEAAKKRKRADKSWDWESSYSSKNPAVESSIERLYGPDWRNNPAAVSAYEYAMNSQMDSELRSHDGMRMDYDTYAIRDEKNNITGYDWNKMYAEPGKFSAIYPNKTIAEFEESNPDFEYDIHGNPIEKPQEQEPEQSNPGFVSVLNDIGQVGRDYHNYTSGVPVDFAVLGDNFYSDRVRQDDRDYQSKVLDYEYRQMWEDEKLAAEMRALGLVDPRTYSGNDAYGAYWDLYGAPKNIDDWTQDMINSRQALVYNLMTRGHDAGGLYSFMDDWGDLGSVDAWNYFLDQYMPTRDWMSLYGANTGKAGRGFDLSMGPNDYLSTYGWLRSNAGYETPFDTQFGVEDWEERPFLNPYTSEWNSTKLSQKFDNTADATMEDYRMAAYLTQALAAGADYTQEEFNNLLNYVAPGNQYDLDDYGLGLGSYNTRTHESKPPSGITPSTSGYGLIDATGGLNKNEVYTLASMGLYPDEYLVDMYGEILNGRNPDSVQKYKKGASK